MRSVKSSTCIASATFLSIAFVHAARAQHLDVLLQVIDGKIVTGAADYDHNTWLVGQTVFERQFLSNFRTNDPGFTGLETGNTLLEPGVVGFDPFTNVFVDIIPTTIDNQWANLWYWDGTDDAQDGFSIEDVTFDLPPAGITWNLFGVDNQLFTADGSDTTLSSALVQTAFSDGGIHEHLRMQVADSDGNSETKPPEGIYLVAMVAHAEGYDASNPFFFVHRTSGLANEPRDIARDWVQANYDLLTQETLTGDYDGDGMVDADDYTRWKQDFGNAVTPEGSGADGNADGAVNLADYIIWRDNLGAGTAQGSLATAAVPEPSCWILTSVTLFSLCSFYQS